MLSKKTRPELTEEGGWWAVWSREHCCYYYCRYADGSDRASEVESHWVAPWQHPQLKKREEENEKKARLIYSEIDLNPLFKGYSVKEDRSIMNATFTLANEDLKETFDTMWKEAGIEGLNGHRSVGGYRASMYNALPLESVQVLVEVMSELESKA